MGHGFVLRIPVVTFHTWSGNTLEGKGVEPDYVAELSRDRLREKRDSQSEEASHIVTGL